MSHPNENNDIRDKHYLIVVFRPVSRSIAPEIGISDIRGADSGTLKINSLDGKIGALSLMSSMMTLTVKSLMMLFPSFTVTSKSKRQMMARLQI